MIVYKIFVGFIFVMIATVMFLYFRSLWVRQGYAGKNGILELYEITAYYIHVVGFLFIFIVAGMIFLPPIIKYQFPREAWAFIGIVFTLVLGHEVYIDMRRRFKLNKHEIND